VIPALENLLNRRAEQVAAMDSILEQVAERDSGDLVPAERDLLEVARSTISDLDAQIAPLEQWDSARAAHTDTLARLPRVTVPAPARADGGDRVPQYPSAGAFLVDYLRARGIMERGVSDAEASARVQAAYQARVVADQKTGDTAGILPTPIVGGVVDLIDANRPLITSLGGAMGLAGIPGATFSRPKISQHTTVGVQAGEKTQLPSQKMSITGVSFTKSTYGGTVDISRQDIDWTSPGAWDILVRDLADVYAIQTETAVAAAFKTAATHAAVAVATNTLADWTKALYLAAADSYANTFRMPDRIWCSLDVWAALGSLVDVSRVVFPVNTTNEMGASGTSSMADFRGDVLGLPRVVVPTFPSGTCIVGPSSLFEVYEEVIGLLSVVEPSILGVQVAYGGYVAFGTLAGAGFVPLTPPAGLVVPSMVDVTAPDDDTDNTPMTDEERAGGGAPDADKSEDAGNSKPARGKNGG
jgi:HK97 family phage major capsid protein